MRKSNAYYNSLLKEAQLFLNFIDDEKFVLRQIMKTKEFKNYYRNKCIDRQIPPLFFYDENKRKFIYV